jgi:hypothetical protein
MTDSAPIKVFLSYSHQDEDLKDRIRTHLAPLIGEGLITVWDDLSIEPGEEWDPAIEGELRSSGIILLLVSPDFLASGFIMENEVPIAMERHEAGQATVIP